MPTFLFTDIEGSTRLWERYPDLMGEAITRHDAVLRLCIEEFGGQLFKQTGDGVLAVFNEGEPLRCSIEILRRFAEEDWLDIGELRIRVALHRGEAERHGDDYLGPAMNRTARLLNVGWGGQIVLTQAVVDAFDLPPGARFDDLGVHTLKDLSEPQRIYGLVHPDLPLRKFPPLRSLNVHPNNLPTQSTPFVGRRSELAEIAKFLQTPSCRLLTLLGPGGVGKTRIGLQAAAERIDEYPYGVYFVPLAPLASPEFLVQAIAQALSFNFYAEKDPQVQLLNYLRRKGLLILLDNFEHLLEGAPLVTTILEQAPGVKVLATSRERLNLRGEWVFEVRGMRFPGAKGIGDLESYSALELFKQSAVRVRRDFELTRKTKSLVAQVCELVDGLPLALELAASWLRMLDLEEIIQEIEQSLDFLEAATRDLPERHQSLRGVFEYSWKLLNEEEKEALRKLAVFRGGCTKDAAKEVTGASLATLSALVDKSLLRKTVEGRYDLHEVVLQYAGNKLKDSPVEYGKTREQHSRYYAGFLQSRERDLQSAKQVEVWREIRGEYENLRMGWYRAIEDGEADTIDGYLKGITFIYQNEGWLAEAQETLGRAADKLSESGGITLARVLRMQALFSYLSGHFEKARKLLEKSLPIFSGERNRVGEAAALNNLGNVAQFQGNFDEARVSFSKSLALCEKIGDKAGKIEVLNSQGVFMRLRGNYQKAREKFSEALAITEELGNPSSICKTLLNLGNVVTGLGEYAEAKRCYMSSLDIFDKFGNRWNKAKLLNNLGRLALLEGNGEESRRFFSESLAMFRDIGDLWAVAKPLSNLGDLALEEGRYEEAEEFYTERLDISEEINNRQGMAVALIGLSLLAKSRQNYDKAQELVQQSLTIFKDIDDQRGELGALVGLGDVFLERGELEKAREHFTSALDGAFRTEFETAMLTALLGMVKVYVGRGERLKGLGLVRFILGYPNAGGDLKKEAEGIISGLKPTPDEERRAVWPGDGELTAVVESILAENG